MEQKAKFYVATYYYNSIEARRPFILLNIKQCNIYVSGFQLMMLMTTMVLSFLMSVLLLLLP